MKIQNKMIELTSIVLSMIMIVMMLPLATYANIIKDDYIYDSTHIETAFPEEETKETYIVGEDKSGKDISSNTYLMSDGSYLATVYNVPVNFMNNGEFIEIDNTLKETENGYENTSSPVTVNFPKEINEGNFIEYIVNNHSISFSLECLNSEKAEIINPENNDEVKKELHKRIEGEYLTEEE